MLELTKLNKWLIALVIVLLSVTGIQTYLLSQNKSDNQLNRDSQSLSNLSNIPSNPLLSKNWAPNSEFQKMKQNMDRFFGKSFQSSFPSIPSFDLQSMPSSGLNIKEEGNRYIARMNIDGLKETDLKIKVENQNLNISGTLEKTVGSNVNGVFSQQFQSRRFKESITLPGPVKPETVIASYENNLLKITIEKALKGHSRSNRKK